MKKRLNMFSIALLLVFVIFLLRQIFNLSRISSFISINSEVYSLAFLAIVLLVGFVAIYLLYYLPILFVLKTVVVIKYNYVRIPNLKIINTIYEYKEQYLYRVNYHKLKVYRC